MYQAPDSDLSVPNPLPNQDSDLSNLQAPMIEIENKYLVKEMPDLSKITPVEIHQGYLCVGADGSEVRLRRKGDKYSLGVKSEGAEARAQAEVDLNYNQFEPLWPLAQRLDVCKDRYHIPYGEHTIELDVFKGPLQGLVVAEVEFRSEADRASFIPPTWFGRDVTADPLYKNKNLAINGTIPQP
jgi:CYTH domain-containing protein